LWEGWWPLGSMHHCAWVLWWLLCQLPLWWWGHPLFIPCW